MRNVVTSPEAKKVLDPIAKKTTELVAAWVTWPKTTALPKWSQATKSRVKPSATKALLQKIWWKSKWPTAALGGTAGIGYVKNKVLEAEDAYNYDPNVGKYTPIDQVPGMKEWKESQAKKTTPVSYGGGKSTSTGGVSTPDPYANWKASDIEWNTSTRPEWIKSMEPVLIPGTTKKIGELWWWTDLMKAFGEYKGTEAGEGNVTGQNVADFYKKVKAMPKEDLNDFIKWYKAR